MEEIVNTVGKRLLKRACESFKARGLVLPHAVSVFGNRQSQIVQDVWNFA